MKVLALASAALQVLASAAFAQDAPSAAPATKLEAFSMRSGAVIFLGYTVVGGINGADGANVTVEVRETRSAAAAELGLFGVSLAVTEAGRLQRKSTSIVDEDELDALVRGLEYITKVNRAVTKMRNFEAHFKTRGDLSVAVFHQALGDPGFTVSSGRSSRVTARFRIEDADKLRLLLVDAQQQIAAAKQSGR